MNKLTIKYFGMCLLLLIASSCSAVQSDLDISEREYNKRMSQDLLANMSLETMFENTQTRKLAQAAGDGELGLVITLVQQGVDVNSRGKGNATPLFWSMKNFDGYNKLLELGADPNIIFNDGGNVIHWAMRIEDDRFLDAALKHGGDANLVAGMLKSQPVFKIDGSKSKLEILLANGANINARSQFLNPFTDKPMGDTALIDAAGTNDFDSVYILLIKGADYTLKNNNGTDLIDKLNSAKTKLIPSSEEAIKLNKIFNWLDKQ
jgi:ankyrin repeat protein